jgi:hypothetical protein
VVYFPIVPLPIFVSKICPRTVLSVKDRTAATAGARKNGQWPHERARRGNVLFVVINDYGILTKFRDM